jgi:general secretion pathway protein A
MYDDYYRFKQKPFSIAPDPAFLYLSERHREALAHLMYGLRTDGGFVLITGEVGTGKTTLIRSLIDDVPDDLDVAFVLNPRLTVNELLETLCEELGIPERSEVATTNKHLIDRLNKHLLRTHALGRSTVVIIDEAQNLSPAVLEQIRLLTNLETNERKLVRIILLGQPELAEMLDRREDARAYIAHRLSLAGGNPHLFTRGAAHEAYRLSHGIPRLINVIADRALLGTYVEGRPRVTARIVRKAAHEAFGQQTWLRPQLWVGAVAASALVVAGAWALWDRNPQWRAPQTNVSQAAPKVEQEVPAADTRPTDAVTNVPVVTQSDTVQSEPTSIESPPVATPPSTAPAPVTAVDRLARPAGKASAELQRDAYAAVFDRWGTPIQSSDVPCNQAPQIGLQCLKLNGTWHDIERIDHPVVVELWDDRADPYYAALLAHQDDVVSMKLGDQKVEVTAAELASHWYGSYIVLWQMPPDYRGALKLGDEGPSVAWLRQHLASALRIDLRAADPARFDDALRSALMRFQRENGMVPDGVAGPMTWIAMRASDPDATPRLSAGA